MFAHLLLGKVGTLLKWAVELLSKMLDGEDWSGWVISLRLLRLIEHLNEMKRKISLARTCHLNNAQECLLLTESSHSGREIFSQILTFVVWDPTPSLLHYTIGW